MKREVYLVFVILFIFGFGVVSGVVDDEISEVVFDDESLVFDSSLIKGSLVEGEENVVVKVYSNVFDDEGRYYYDEGIGSIESEEYSGYIVEFEEKSVIAKRVELESEVMENEEYVDEAFVFNPKRVYIEIFGIEGDDVEIEVEDYALGLRENNEVVKRRIADALDNREGLGSFNFMDSFFDFIDKLFGRVGVSITGDVVGEEAYEEEVVEGGVVEEGVEEEAYGREVVEGEVDGEGLDSGRIDGEYNLVFNGIALDIDDDEAEIVEGVRGVKRVSPNYKVEAMLMDSVPLIGADRVWELDEYGIECLISRNECLTGKGVSIGIIDTGVDYTHGDLGGCFGQGCKVVGGWDFVNNDADPMDDHGHGTHVAATAAGNGVLRGVAPDAEIYAYKVLSSGGSGSFSNIIASIERSVDPNQDGDTSDHLDVISLSLGGNCGGNYRSNCGPDDSLSKSIDNAVDAGVVAVIAAGNSGPKENSIGTPGTARKAITVGAINKGNGMASFSSRGPVEWDDEQSVHRILNKPDIVAPGVNICAAQWDGAWDDRKCEGLVDEEHVQISGTSMATPHVSGAVALLIQKNKDWTSREVKIALMNTAIDIGEEINTQGYGGIEVENAIAYKDYPSIADISTEGGFIEGDVIIEGTASGRSFQSYSVYLGLGKNPQDWILLKESFERVEEGVLINNIDMDPYSNSHVSFLLLVNNVEGMEVRDRIDVVLYDADIVEPIGSDSYKLGKIVDIKGTVRGRFDRYSVEYGVWENEQFLPESWSSEGIILEGEGIVGVDNGLIARWDTSFIDSDFYTIRVGLFLGESVKYYYVKQIYVDDRLKEGWPRIIPNTRSSGYPAFFLEPNVIDLDNDGDKEIIVISDGNPPKLYVFNADGSDYPGWPIEIDGLKAFFRYNENGVVAGDLDGDGMAEMIVNGQNKIMILNHDGTLYRETDDNTLFPVSNVISDIDNDGNMEIIRRYEVSREGREIVITDVNGNVKEGWPKRIYETDNGRGVIIRCLSWDTHPSPAVGDIDGDGFKEIVDFSSLNHYEDDWDINDPLDKFECRSRLHVFNMDGSYKEGFPVDFNGRVFASPIIADINNDGERDIILTNSENGPISFRGGVFVVNNVGNIIMDWEILDGARVKNTPSVVDIDNDGNLEIPLFVASYGDGSRSSANIRQQFLLKGDGTVVDGWPYSRGIGYNRRTSVTGNIDSDMDIEIVGVMGSGFYTSSRVYGGVVGLDIDGKILEGYPLIIGNQPDAGATIEDLDGDGFNEIIASSFNEYDRGKKEIKHRGSVYVWETDGVADDSGMSWPMFQYDPQHTGCYNCNTVIDDPEPPIQGDVYKFEVRDSIGEVVAWLGSDGNIVLKGSVSKDYFPSGEALVVKDSLGDVSSYIDEEGMFYYTGLLTENALSCEEVSSDDEYAVSVKGGDGGVAGYIKYNGDVCLKGQIFINAI